MAQWVLVSKRQDSILSINKVWILYGLYINIYYNYIIIYYNFNSHLNLNYHFVKRNKST